MTIIPDSPHEQTNREAEWCCIAATKQKCAEIKRQAPARLGNFVRQNSKKMRGRLINGAKHLDRNRLKVIVRC